MPPRPRDRPAYSEGRDALLEAATRVIARDGFRGLTYRAVAQEAGVTHGLVSYHFGSRDALVHETLAALARASIDGASLVPDSGRLEDLARDLVTVAREAPDAQAAQFELTLEARRRPALRPEVRALYDGYVDAIAQALATADVPADPALARLVFAALDGLMLQQLVFEDEEETQAALGALRRLLQGASPGPSNEHGDGPGRS
ncbi:Transcriptional regulator TetR family [Patulibacter medicamentivorans]|uniref:Transcriptional regulator TetR family n=1 Tax=Patulibacter medicamentivorans TaxID=1097667 RepID=H0E0P9_9ACTN|nr:TetR family transcriptional regulator [Patulibacter medicamentivorans]EHN12783.1 Transcriptional regulator TetR family [Patulibacter medicamentivorans]